MQFSKLIENSGNFLDILRHLSQKNKGSKEHLICLVAQNTTYSLGSKVRDKLTKLSKIGFSTECFTGDFFTNFY